MTNTQSELICLLRCAVLDAPLPEGFRVTDADGLFRLAKTHDLAHLVSHALKRHDLLDAQTALGKQYDRQQMLAVWRVNVLMRDLADAGAALERAGVDYLPLKGAVLRRLYPEPWMRTSGDIDLLVRRDAGAAAVEALTAGGFRCTASGTHYDHVESPSGFHIDLHIALTDQKTAASPLLDRAWDAAVPEPGAQHAWRMPDTLLYLFHMAHAAKHALHGSCGVRTVLDTWMLNHRTDFDAAARRAVLERSGLTRFADALEAVAEAWFSGAPLDARYAAAEAFFFGGGVYLSRQNRAAVQARKGGRLGHVLRRAFPPAYAMRTRYPVLERHKALLPLCWADRFVKGLRSGKVRQARRESAALLRQARQPEAQAMSRLFHDLGLTNDHRFLKERQA